MQERNPQGNKDFEEEYGFRNSDPKKNKNSFPNPNFKMKLEHFKYLPDKFEKGSAIATTGVGPQGMMNKSFQEVLPSFLNQIQLMKELNDYFIASTGLNDY